MEARGLADHCGAQIAKQWMRYETGPSSDNAYTCCTLSNIWHGLGVRCVSRVPYSNSIMQFNYPYTNYQQIFFALCDGWYALIHFLIAQLKGFTGVNHSHQLQRT